MFPTASTHMRETTHHLLHNISVRHGPNAYPDRAHIADALHPAAVKSMGDVHHACTETGNKGKASAV